MRKVIVIGCPGGGKSTFARALHEITGLPLVCLDQLYWNADRTTVPKEVFRARLAEAMAGDAWIIDGNYGSTMEMRLAACDTVFFLDYPAQVCLAGIRERMGKPRDDIPWVETEEDAEFMQYVRDFEKNSRPQVQELLRLYGDKACHVFRTREEADGYLRSLRGEREEKRC